MYSIILQGIDNRAKLFSIRPLLIFNVGDVSDHTSEEEDRNLIVIFIFLR